MHGDEEANAKADGSSSLPKHLRKSVRMWPRQQNSRTKLDGAQVTAGLALSGYRRVPINHLAAGRMIRRGPQASRLENVPETASFEQLNIKLGVD
jgi:hypothetical protein